MRIYYAISFNDTKWNFCSFLLWIKTKHASCNNKMKSDWVVWCSSGMWSMGMAAYRMYSFYTYRILDCASLCPCLSPTCVHLLHSFFLFYINILLFPVHTNTKMLPHKYIDTTCMQYQYALKLLASLIGIYFVCYFHALLSLTQSTLMKDLPLQTSLWIYVFVKNISYIEDIKSTKCTFWRIMNCVNSGKCWSATYCLDL